MHLALNLNFFLFFFYESSSYPSLVIFIFIIIRDFICSMFWCYSYTDWISKCYMYNFDEEGMKCQIERWRSVKGSHWLKIQLKINHKNEGFNFEFGDTSMTSLQWSNATTLFSLIIIYSSVLWSISYYNNCESLGNSLLSFPFKMLEFTKR